VSFRAGGACQNISGNVLQEFKKRSQPIIRARDEILSVTAVRIDNKDGPPVGITHCLTTMLRSASVPTRINNPVKYSGNTGGAAVPNKANSARFTAPRLSRLWIRAKDFSTGSYSRILQFHRAKCGTGKKSPISSVRTVGLGAPLQRSIPTVEPFLLLTHTATTGRAGNQNKGYTEPVEQLSVRRSWPLLCVVRLVGLVERQSAFSACGVFFGEVWSFEEFRFPFNGLLEISRFGIGGSQRVQESWIFRQFPGLDCIVYSFLAVAETDLRTCPKKPCEAIVGERVFWVEPDGFVVVGNGLVVIALVVVGGATDLVSFRAFWIEPDGFVVVGNSLVVVTLAFIGAATVNVGEHVFWVESDNFVVIGNGLVVLSTGLIAVT